MNAPRVTIKPPAAHGDTWRVIPSPEITDAIGHVSRYHAKNRHQAWALAEDIARDYAAYLTATAAAAYDPSGPKQHRGRTPP